MSMDVMKGTASSSSSSGGGGVRREDDEMSSSDGIGDKYSTRESRFSLIHNEFGDAEFRSKFCRETFLDGFKDLSKGLTIHPNNRWYRAWTKFILLWALYSSVFTPLEFGFFRGLPENLFILDIVGQIAFLVDIAMQFFVGYRDGQTYRMIYKRSPIAFRVNTLNLGKMFLGCYVTSSRNINFLI